MGVDEMACDKFRSQVEYLFTPQILVKIEYFNRYPIFYIFCYPNQIKNVISFLIGLHKEVFGTQLRSGIRDLSSLYIIVIFNVDKRTKIFVLITQS